MLTGVASEVYPSLLNSTYNQGICHIRVPTLLELMVHSLGQRFGKVLESEAYQRRIRGESHASRRRSARMRPGLVWLRCGANAVVERPHAQRTLNPSINEYT